MQAFSPYESLNRKRRGEELSDAEIQQFLEGFTSGSVPDYQMSAMLMAIAIRGMSPRETSTLTRAMTESGEQWRLRDRFDFVADKHSTGGVGDKISLVLAPLVASCGAKVAMLSGRGLGHTGGTLDKLEAIPGFRAGLSRAALERCLDEVGCVIATSTEGIAPADRKLYALRDVTATVESIPLITASIMSKKLALGASALILDVKVGSGAFCSDLRTARALAHSLIGAAEGSGTRVEAMITDMEQPLGRACGNANEVLEAFDILAGEGPRDVRDLSVAQATRILVMSGKHNEKEARSLLETSLDSGRAHAHALRWIEAQGGDPEALASPRRMPRPSAVLEMRAERSGFIRRLDAYRLGMLAIELGTGRRKQDDRIEPAAGILLDRKRGDEVREGDVLAEIEIGRRGIDEEALRHSFRSAIEIGDTPPEPRPLIFERMSDTVRPDPSLEAATPGSGTEEPGRKDAE